MKRGYDRKSSKAKERALEAIRDLFGQAELVFKEDPKLSDRYVELARKTAMKLKVRMPRQFARRYCKSCHAFHVPGANLRVRLNRRKIVHLCLRCKHISRYPLPRSSKVK
jgi:ribonuclease P protein subunit RPR2